MAVCIGRLSYATTSPPLLPYTTTKSECELLVKEKLQRSAQNISGVTDKWHFSKTVFDSELNSDAITFQLLKLTIQVSLLLNFAFAYSFEYDIKLFVRSRNHLFEVWLLVNIYIYIYIYIFGRKEYHRHVNYKSIYTCKPFSVVRQRSRCYNIAYWTSIHDQISQRWRQQVRLKCWKPHK
jgi:hypothetical protein